MGHLTIFPGHVGVVSAVSSFHGESLAGASLSVGEDCAVVPLHHLVSGINKRSHATVQWPRNQGKKVFPSQYLTDQRLHNASIHFQLLALDAKHFVKLEGLSEGGGGLLLDGDLLGVRGVHHAVRALCLLGVVQWSAPARDYSRSCVHNQKI